MYIYIYIYIYSHFLSVQAFLLSLAYLLYLCIQADAYVKGNAKETNLPLDVIVPCVQKLCQPYAQFRMVCCSDYVAHY